VSEALPARSEFRRTAVGRRASLVTFLSRTRKSLGRRDELPASVFKAKTASKKIKDFYPSTQIPASAKSSSFLEHPFEQAIPLPAKESFT
jgi:hypothetical protein